MLVALNPEREGTLKDVRIVEKAAKARGTPCKAIPFNPKLERDRVVAEPPTTIPSFQPAPDSQKPWAMGFMAYEHIRSYKER